MLTCHIQYTVDPTKIDDFKVYATNWIALIEKYGGTHHGYFLPNDTLNDELNASFSFPDIAKKGRSNTAIALFSFDNNEAYQHYRKAVKDDPLCIEMTQLATQSQCFSRYERLFLTPLK